MNEYSEEVRRESVRQMLANQALEGITPSAAMLDDLQRFIDGEITIDQVLELVLARRSKKD